MNKTDKIKKNVPSYFKPTTNVQWKALLGAHGEEDERIVEQIREANKQIFIEKAEGIFLDDLGDNVSVFRPLELNLSDNKYRELIKFLSFYPKQIKSLIYKVLDVFFDPVFSRYSVETGQLGPYNLSGGEGLVFKTESDGITQITKRFTVDGEIDGPNKIRVLSTSGMYIGQTVVVSDDDSKETNSTVIDLTNTIITIDKPVNNYTVDQNAIIFFKTYQYLIFKSSDFETPGSVTTSEIATAINKVARGSFAETISSSTKVSLRTDVVGNKGLIQVLGGNANNVLNFPTLPSQLLKVQISEINSNEIIIKIPSTIPVLRKTLRGSAHFHPNSDITEGWPGSFIYDPNIDYTVQERVTTLNQPIVKGFVYTEVSVINSSIIPNNSGNLMFNFGREGMEYPIRYIGRPNNSTLLLDPGYVFTRNHQVGELINTILTQGVIPRVDGGDYPVFLVGTAGAREQVQAIVRSIIATGVVIRWDVISPVCGKV